MKRKSSDQRPLRSGNFGSVQATGDHDLNTLSTEPLRLFHRLFHRPAKSNSLFELLGDLFGLKLSVQLRVTYLLNRDKHFASGLSGQVLAKLFDLRTFSPNDDPRSGGVNN